ncbi:hypothetical protein [Gelidibacter japonicus]|uniref:hypothetical protein n=1 Tax=Gelidibacter japonicus TaxID=1962232 RepID=UPI003A8EBD31
MTKKLTILFLVIFQLSVAQHYDTVVLDTGNIDATNEVYKVGNTYVFNYEIIRNGKILKLKTNKGMYASTVFELVPLVSPAIEVDRIRLIVQQVSDAERTNEGQTEISYIQEPLSRGMSLTGLVDNADNIWLHPIRTGFFNALQTAPFPFVKKPLKVGNEWSDKMAIGKNWGNVLWGTWEEPLLLSYHYKVTTMEMVKTAFGTIECYVIESNAKSDIGETKLKSYFSEIYGFVRLEYELLNGIKVNFWLMDFKKG